MKRFAAIFAHIVTVLFSRFLLRKKPTRHFSRFLIASCLILLSCGTSVEQKSIEYVPEPTLIADFFLVDQHPNLQYYEIESHQIDLNDDRIMDQVSILVIKNWSDPGDFHKIRITVAGMEPKEYINHSGWVSFNNNYPIAEQLKAQNLLDSKNILLSRVSPSTRVLMLFGWVYASQPGLLTIINARNQSVLFNKEWSVHTITDKNDDGFAELYGSSNPGHASEMINFSQSAIVLKSLD